MANKNNFDIRSEIQNLLSERFEVEKSKIVDSVSLTTDLGIDSFEVVELLYELELKYNIRIPNDDIGKLRTIGEVVGYLSKKIGDTNSGEK
jgi:acyl carrier protein